MNRQKTKVIRVPESSNEDCRVSLHTYVSLDFDYAFGHFALLIKSYFMIVSSVVVLIFFNDFFDEKI